MKEVLKKFARELPFYYLLRKWVAKRRLDAKFAEWIAAGRPVPPPHFVKLKNLRQYARSYGLRILVETGTYRGDTVNALMADFDRIYSIELSMDLYKKALVRFSGADHVEIIQGNSGIELAKIMPKIDQPALFWLDGHYSEGITARAEKDTPVLQELQHILDSKDLGHVIIIDDARFFGSDPGYPDMKELNTLIKSRRPNVDITVADDSIRVTPKRTHQTELSESKHENTVL